MADIGKKSTTSGRYKTELCRAFIEKGVCKYGDKCQFAHGSSDLRSTPRHPKYKTEMCRTFQTSGACPYGSRCHFVHVVEGGSPATPAFSGIPLPLSPKSDASSPSICEGRLEPAVSGAVATPHSPECGHGMAQPYAAVVVSSQLQDQQQNQQRQQQHFVPPTPSPPTHHFMPSPSPPPLLVQQQQQQQQQHYQQQQQQQQLNPQPPISRVPQHQRQHFQQDKQLSQHQYYQHYQQPQPQFQEAGMQYQRHLQQGATGGMLGYGQRQQQQQHDMAFDFGSMSLDKRGPGNVAASNNYNLAVSNVEQNFQSTSLSDGLGCNVWGGSMDGYNYGHSNGGNTSHPGTASNACGFRVPACALGDDKDAGAVSNEKSRLPFFSLLSSPTTL